MNNIITTSCTAINELVEKYYTDMIPYMAPIVSPMTAHAMMLKKEFGPDVKVVYIGSCTARGREAVRERCRGTYVDAVLDFQELRSWFAEADIDLNTCEFTRGKAETQWLTVFMASAAVFWRRWKPMRDLENMNSFM